MEQTRNWRVYVQDWTIDYTSDASGEAGAAEASQVFGQVREGRLEQGDWFIYSHGPAARALIFVRIHQLRAERKERQDAEALAGHLEPHADWLPIRDQLLPGPPAVVAAGSPEEQALLDYGKRKLPG
jgi:hypothetical protein